MTKKQKCVNLGPKMPYFSIFALEFEKKEYSHIWNQRPLFWLVVKSSAKIKILKFATENSWFGISELEFENNIVIYEISTLKFVQLHNFMKKWIFLNLGPEIPYLGIFGLEF